MSAVKDGFARIDNGPPVPAELTVEHERHVVRSSGPRPNPRWTFVDSAGHFHAYSHDESLPTMQERSERVPCDGSCGEVCDDGYEVISHVCRICGEEITPGALRGPHEVQIDGPTRWELVVEASVPPGEVTVRVGVERFELFGVAAVEPEVASGFVGVHTTLRGIGPLGRRSTTDDAGSAA